MRDENKSLPGQRFSRVHLVRHLKKSFNVQVWNYAAFNIAVSQVLLSSQNCSQWMIRA